MAYTKEVLSKCSVEINFLLKVLRCTILDAWGWCTGMTQRDGMGREEGSGWGTHVYLWQIHFDIWQNQYNIVKLNKIKKKKSVFYLFYLVLQQFPPEGVYYS